MATGFQTCFAAYMDRPCPIPNKFCQLQHRGLDAVQLHTPDKSSPSLATFTVLLATTPQRAICQNVFLPSDSTQPLAAQRTLRLQLTQDSRPRGLQLVHPEVATFCAAPPSHYDWRQLRHSQHASESGKVTETPKAMNGWKVLTSTSTPLDKGRLLPASTSSLERLAGKKRFEMFEKF